MKKLLKRLTPNAFLRIDDYLLRNYPTVWRTRIHIVLPLAVLAFPVLFAAGYFLPKNTFLEPLVDPIKPIQITKEIYFWISFVFAMIAIFYWGFTQYQHKFDKVKPLKVVATLLIYGIDLFVILGLDTVAFRLGTIVQTTSLMTENDLDYVEGNNYFMYGFFPHHSIRRGDEYEYFKNDIIFENLVKREDSVLTNRYNISRLFNLSDTAGIPSSYKSYRTHLSHLSHTDVWNESYLSNKANISNRLYKSYLSDISCLSNQPNISCIPNLDILLLENGNPIYQTYKSFLSNYLSKNNRFVGDNDVYQIYYKDSIFTKINIDSLSNYGLDFSFKKFECESLTFDIPQYFYPLEDGVRSVRHARQYLNEGIIYRHIKMLLPLIPYFTFLFFVIPFLPIRDLLGVLATYLLVMFLFLKDESVFALMVSIASMIIIILPTLLALILSLLFSQKYRKTTTSIGLIFLVVYSAWTAIFFIINYKYMYVELKISFPLFRSIFYFITATCLLTPFLFSNLKGLPKSR